MFWEKREDFDLQAACYTALQSTRFPKCDRYKVATEIIFPMSLNCEVGKEKHIPVSGCGTV